MRPVLLVPGIFNSGPGHWQTLWEERLPGVHRVQQRDWEHPVCGEWVDTLDAAIAKAGEPVLVAHSLGCLVVAHWAAQSDRVVHGMLLVAVPDPTGRSFPREAIGFAAVPSSLRERHVTVVSSSDDPYSSAAFVNRCVALWGAEHVQLGAVGHINAESGLGAWPQGWAMVETWRE